MGNKIHQNDTKTNACNQVEQIAQNLDPVGHLVGQLRNMAVGIGQEVTRQNMKIDGIASKTEDADERQKKTRRLTE